MFNPLYKKIKMGSTSIVNEAKMVLNSNNSGQMSYSFPKMDIETNSDADDAVDKSSKGHPHDLTTITNDIGSYIIMDSKVFLDIIYDGYLEKPCSICKKNKVYLDSYTSK